MSTETLLKYDEFALRGDGGFIIRYLKEAKAYRQHKIYVRGDPDEDGVLLDISAQSCF
jgi:hypothetical protein